MSESLRAITQIQLADGCTIDGDRLEGFLDDLVNRVNALEKSDLYRKLIPTVFVGGYENGIANGTLPWMPNFNQASEVIAGGTQPPLGFMNAFRLKGTGIPDLDVTDQVDTQIQYAWTNALYFRKPVVLHGISITLQELATDWLYSGAAPSGSSIGDAFNDFFLDVSIDNPFLAEDRRLADVEVHRMRFRLDGEFFSSTGVNLCTAYLDMVPPRAATDQMEAVHIDLRNLNIPLHRDTRLRISFVIPKYFSSPYGWTSWPYRLNNYTWTVTTLEGLEAP